MKKIILLLSVILFFSACEKVDDDSGLVCTQNCTSISGKVYTQGNIPLRNVMMKFRFRKSIGTNAHYNRIMSKERSNNLGQYSMDFFIKNEELGEGVGSFDLYPDKTTLPGNVFYPDYSDLFYGMYDIMDRDFSLQKNLYLPTLKKVKIKLTNFHGVAQEDYFRILVHLPCGFDYDQIIPETGNNHNYSVLGANKYVLNKYGNNNVPDKVFEVDFALNELNYIVLGRMKNDVYSEEIIPINVTANTNTILEYSYE
jgi:hypothetical protein